MQIHKNEITTGILVLVTGGIFIATLVVIGMPGLIQPLNTYRIYYDNAKGIRSGAPVLIAGRVVGKVTRLQSPVPLERRPAGHPDYEVCVDVQVPKDAVIFRKVIVRLTQQGLMGQQMIDFVQDDLTSGVADNHTEFLGERVLDLSESMTSMLEHFTGPDSDLALTLKNAKLLTEPDSDLAVTIQNAKIFTEILNKSKISQVIQNTEQMTDTLKREPWRIIWPSTKHYPEDEKLPSAKKK